MIPTTSITVQPNTEPITLAEAKEHLNVDFSDDDYLISQLITSARQQVEEYTNLKLITQTVVERFDDFPATGVLTLNFSPVASISSVTYTDTDGNEQTWDSSLYDTDIVGKPARIKPVEGGTWPTTKDKLNSVAITYVVGYGGADDVPGPIKSAMLLMISELYDYRHDRPVLLQITQSRNAWRSMQLLNPYRIFTF